MHAVPLSQQLRAVKLDGRRAQSAAREPRVSLKKELSSEGKNRWHHGVGLAILVGRGVHSHVHDASIGRVVDARECQSGLPHARHLTDTPADAGTEASPALPPASPTAPMARRNSAPHLVG